MRETPPGMPDDPTPSAAPARPAAGPDDPESDPHAGYRRWAMVLFGVSLAVVVVAGSLLLLSGIAPDAVTLPLVSAALVIATILLIEIVGIHDRRPWALAAIAPMCAILIVGGLVKVVVALASGNITIPLEAVAAALVLTRRPPSGSLTSLDAAGELRRAAIVVPFALLTFWPLLPPSG